jgi:hypothetical protein
MREIIDYAGLFPPAKLDLKPALEEYARTRGGAHSWMLGRFIVDTRRIGDLARLSRETLSGTNVPVQLCVILGSAESAGEALDTARADIETVRSVIAGYRDTVFVDGFEIRIPAQTVETAVCASFLAGLRDIIESAGIRGAELFAEVPATLEWRRNDTAAVEGFAAYATSFPDDTTLRRTGFKLRCGGLEPQAFPPAERIAGIIADCRDQMVPLKFTAGLHHPVRFHDPGLGVTQHGFLNVFGAGVMASALNTSRAELTECLLDENSYSFRFDGARFHWRDRVVTTAQIARGREALVTAFGSCSFDEPLDDLRTLGIKT